MIIDISFKKECPTEDIIKKTTKFLGIDYTATNNQYICAEAMLFSIHDEFIHISSIYETDIEIQFVKNYIRSLFEGRFIAISCRGLSESFRHIPGVEVYDITPSFFQN